MPCLVVKLAAKLEKIQGEEHFFFKFSLKIRFGKSTISFDSEGVGQ